MTDDRAVRLSDDALPFAHVPGCGCETEDAPYNNRRDQTCIEWTAIVKRRVEELLASRERAAAEAKRIELEDAWDNGYDTGCDGDWSETHRWRNNPYRQEDRNG